MTCGYRHIVPEMLSLPWWRSPVWTF